MCFLDQILFLRVVAVRELRGLFDLKDKDLAGRTEYREMNNDFPQGSTCHGVRQRFVDRDGSNGNAGATGRLP
jgi:hypothetical protein